MSPTPRKKQISRCRIRHGKPRRRLPNAVFAGTSVISGTATILICRTGNRTALGHLATSLSEKPPATAFTMGIRRIPACFDHALHDTDGAVRARGEHRLRATDVGIADVRRRTGRRSDARAVTDDRYGHAGQVRNADGEAEGDREAPVRDPRRRRHERSVHRQDRHVDRSRDGNSCGRSTAMVQRVRTHFPMPISTASSRAG